MQAGDRFCHLARSGGDHSVRHQGIITMLAATLRRSSTVLRGAGRAAGVRLYAVRARATPSADSAPRANLSAVLVIV